MAFGVVRIFRERFEKRLLEEHDTALDLRPDRDEDPESPEYKARLLAALVEDDKTVVGAAVVHEGVLFRIPAIATGAHPHSTRLLVWSLNRAPVLPDQVVESVNILREAHVSALMGLVANHGMTRIPARRLSKVLIMLRWTMRFTVPKCSAGCAQRWTGRIGRGTRRI